MNESVLVLTNNKCKDVKEEELKEVLERNDGDSKRFKDYKESKMIWGYLCKIIDYHKYSLMDMDKVILFLEKNGDVYSYEHTGDFYPESKEDKKVIGIMDKNAEITPC